MDAIILVERAKREAAEVIERYERKLVQAGRIVEFVQLGVLRYLMTAPVNFLERVDALREACPEMDRVRAREELRQRLDAWRQQMDEVDRVMQEGDGEEGDGD